MSEFHLAEAQPSHAWLYPQVHQLDLDASLATLGADLTDPIEGFRVRQKDDSYRWTVLLVALKGPTPTIWSATRSGLPPTSPDPGEVLGFASFALPMRTNTHLVDDLNLQVTPVHRRRRIGGALLSQVLRVGIENGRRTVMGWSDHGIADGDDAASLIPNTGVGSIPRDTNAKFALAAGFVLEQVEWGSRLLLPHPHLDDLEKLIPARTLKDYRIESWSGPANEQQLNWLRELRDIFSEEVPVAGLDWHPVEHDLEQVRSRDRERHQNGHAVVSVAIHRRSGELAGFTDINVSDSQLHRPLQYETAVAVPHRGNRLGVALKVRNLQLLALDSPTAQAIYTWNAAENQPMLDVNHAIGFQIFGTSGMWQHRISEPN